MKYTITINQFALFSAGLYGKVDYSDIAILEYLKDFVYYKNHKSIQVQNNEYIWLNYNHLIASLPFAYLKTKTPVSKRIMKLKNLGLINTYQAKDRTLYYTFTDKMIDLLFYTKTPFKPLKISHRFTPHLLSNGTMINNKINSSSQQHRAIGAGEPESISHSRENGNPDRFPRKAGNYKNWIPAGVYPAHRCGTGMTPPCAPCLSGKEVKGFNSMNGIWKVLANIKQRNTGAKYES